MEHPGRDVMEKIELTTDLVNAILQYLGNQPFVQVAGLIQAIQKETTPQVQQVQNVSGSN